MKIFVLVSLFVSAILQEGSAGSSSRSLPKSFIKCKRNDPNFGDCLRRAVEDSFEKMKNKGIPSLGVLPLEPLDIQEMKLNAGTPTSPVNLRIDFRNMKMHGVADTTFTYYKTDFDKANIHTVSLTPAVSFDSEYNATGKILVIPVIGEGYSNFTMTDLETISDLTFKPEERNGETFWIIQSFHVTFKPKKMTMNFSGLLSQDKTLSDGINKFINENWEVVFEGLRSEFEASFGAVFKEITSRVFNKVPINKIFES